MNSKQKLYESIMNKVSKVVKNTLNESRQKRYIYFLRDDLADQNPFAIDFPDIWNDMKKVWYGAYSNAPGYISPFAPELSEILGAYIYKAYKKSGLDMKRFVHRYLTFGHLYAHLGTHTEDDMRMRPLSVEELEDYLANCDVGIRGYIATREVSLSDDEKDTWDDFCDKVKRLIKTDKYGLLTIFGAYLYLTTKSYKYKDMDSITCMNLVLDANKPGPLSSKYIKFIPFIEEWSKMCGEILSHRTL